MERKERSGVHAEPSSNEKTLAAWEIVSVTLSFLIMEWVVVPFAGENRFAAAIPLGLAFILIFLSHRARRETARDIGFRTDNFFRATRLLLLPTVVAALVVLVIAWRLKNPRLDNREFWSWALWLVVWGLMQQYVLQGFVNRRAQIIWGRGWPSIILVASVFALLHLPNPWLTLATFAGGAVWAAVYQREPNLLALGLSHTLMALVLAVALPTDTLNNLRVGFKYFG